MKKASLLFIVCLTIAGFLACSKKNNAPTPPVVVAPPISATSKIFYVSNSGDDSRTATQAKNAATPWRTIQKASSSITSGDTVVIMGGTYNEKVIIGTNCSGTAAKPTLFQNKDGETVIIDGGVSNPNSAVVRWVSELNVNAAQYIRVKGIRVQNANWYGIRVENNASFITIDGCSTFNTGASGIYVNTSANIDVVNNKVLKACQVTSRDASGNGTQECITLTRTNNFIVNNNEVGESTVSGAAGGEGIDVKGLSSNGEVASNYIHDILVLGIYIDAGSGEQFNIRVFGNRVVRTFGLGVAAELGGLARDIYFYNNIITDSDKSGIVFQETGNGQFINVYVVNNTFYNNALNGFAGDVGSFTRNTVNSNNVIRNNIFYNKITNSRFSIWHNYPAGHVISNNLYFDFKPSVNATLSFTAANLTAADIRDLDPLFVNAGAANFMLQASSPAINKGMVINMPNTTTPMFTTDFTGKSKGASNWDMGAYEF